MIRGPILAMVVIAAISLWTGTAAAVQISRCVLEVAGKTYLDGPCNYQGFGDGSFSIGTDEATSPYFAYVQMDVAGFPTTGSWNGAPENTHAHDPLGELRRDGACCVNDTARVCAYR